MLKMKKGVIAGVFAVVLVVAAIPIVNNLQTINAPNTSADTEYEVNGATYTYTVSYGEIVLKDVVTAEKELVLPSEIDGIKVVGVQDASTFFNATSVTKLTIPATFSSNSFRGSTLMYLKDLTEINVDPDNADFAAEDGLLYTKDFKRLLLVPINYGTPGMQYTIKVGVTRIDQGAFMDNRNIKSVNVSTSVETIDTMAFAGMESLETANVAVGVKSIKEGAFSKCSKLNFITVAATNKNYEQADGVLYNKGQTTLVQYPSGKTNDYFKISDKTTTIGIGAFAEASYLKAVNFSNVAVIGTEAFQNSGLETVDLPASVTTINGDAFSNCANLKSVTMKNTVSKLGKKAFSDCASLKTVVLSDYIRTIDELAFGGDTALTDITFPHLLTEIKAFAFQSCTSLVDVHLPATLKKVEPGAFFATNVSAVYIPQNVVEIGNVAFTSNIFTGQNLTVTGYGNTYAKDYANENGFNFFDNGEFVFKNGDLDGDGIVSSYELQQILRSILGKEVVEQYWLATIADDQPMTSADLIKVKRELAKQIKDSAQ